MPCTCMFVSESPDVKPQFGLGYNSCVGQNLARIELSKILATIVRGYNIRQVDPKQEWSYKPYFTVVPGGWPVYVEKHEN